MYKQAPNQNQLVLRTSTTEPFNVNISDHQKLEHNPTFNETHNPSTAIHPLQMHHFKEYFLYLDGEWNTAANKGSSSKEVTYWISEAPSPCCCWVARATDTRETERGVKQSLSSLSLWGCSAVMELTSFSSLSPSLSLQQPWLPCTPA